MVKLVSRAFQLCLARPCAPPRSSRVAVRAFLVDLTEISLTNVSETAAARSLHPFYVSHPLDPRPACSLALKTPTAYAPLVLRYPIGLPPVSRLQFSPCQRTDKRMVPRTERRL